MPRRDGTGPMGMGAMTGRGAGFCSVPRPASSRRGMGMGFGRRANGRRMFCLAGVLPGCAYLAYRWYNRNKI